jgi:hypothetical protein
VVTVEVLSVVVTKTVVVHTVEVLTPAAIAVTSSPEVVAEASVGAAAVAVRDSFGSLPAGVGIPGMVTVSTCIVVALLIG